MAKKGCFRAIQRAFSSETEHQLLAHAYYEHKDKSVLGAMNRVNEERRKAEVEMYKRCGE